MDFSALIAELRSIANRYDGKDIDSNVSTVMYCEMFRKILQKAESEVTAYDDQIVILWMTLSQLCQTYKTLVPCPDRNSLYQHIFLLCAKIVLNIKWQQLSDDDQSKQNFRATVEATHKQLITAGFDRFGLLMDIMENPWTDPTISRIMSGEREEEEEEDEDETECESDSEEAEKKKERKKKKMEHNEELDEEYKKYIEKEDPLILRLRVEMLMQENCEEWALNLCNCCLRQTKFNKDLDFKVMQLTLLFRLNQLDKLQEECESIMCHTGISIIEQLEKKESNQAVCVRLIQIFLVQDWIKPDRNCCTKNLLQIWIKYQSLEDKDREKFLDSVWAIAKISSKTEQICTLVTGLMKKCGMNLIQLYTDLCVYAINVDKGRCEQQMLLGNMEGVKSQQLAIAVTCLKFADLYCNCCPKLARIAALTAFALNPIIANFNVVRKTFTDKRKEKMQAVKADYSPGKEPKEYKPRQSRYLNKVNPATLHEVERLLNMLRPYYLDPELTLAKLLPVCQKFMEEKGTFQTVKKPPETKKKCGPPKLSEVQYYCDDSVKIVKKRENKSNSSSVGQLSVQEHSTTSGQSLSISPYSEKDQIFKNSVKTPLFGNKPHSYRAMSLTETSTVNKSPKPIQSVQKPSSTQRLVPAAVLIANQHQKSDLQRANSSNSIAELLKATKTLPQNSSDSSQSSSASSTNVSSHGYASQNLMFDKNSSETGLKLNDASRRHSVNLPLSSVNKTLLTINEQQKSPGVRMEYQEVIGNAGDKAIYHHLYQSVPTKVTSKILKPPQTTLKVSSVESSKSSQRPRIIPMRSQSSNDDKNFLPYPGAQKLISQGGIQNTAFSKLQSQIASDSSSVSRATAFLNSTSQSGSNLSNQLASAGSQRRPSAEELKSIVDWLQSGTEDAVKSSEDNTVKCSQTKMTPLNFDLSKTGYSNLNVNTPQTIHNTTQQNLKLPVHSSANTPHNVQSSGYGVPQCQTISQLLVASANLGKKSTTSSTVNKPSAPKQLPAQSKSPKTKKIILQQTASQISKKLASIQKSPNSSSSTITAQLLLNLQQRGMLSPGTANQSSEQATSQVVAPVKNIKPKDNSSASTSVNIQKGSVQNILTSKDLSLEEMKRRIAEIVKQQKQLVLDSQNKPQPQVVAKVEAVKQRKGKSRTKSETSNSSIVSQTLSSLEPTKGRTSESNTQVSVSTGANQSAVSSVSSHLTQEQLKRLQQHLSESGNFTSQQQLLASKGLGLVQQSQVIPTMIQQHINQVTQQVQSATQQTTLSNIQIVQQQQQQQQQTTTFQQQYGQPAVAGSNVALVVQPQQQQQQQTSVMVTQSSQKHSLPNISVLVQQPVVNHITTNISGATPVASHSHLTIDSQMGQLIQPVQNLQGCTIITSSAAVNQTLSLPNTALESQNVQQQWPSSSYSTSSVPDSQNTILYQSTVPQSQSGSLSQNIVPQNQSGLLSQSTLLQGQSAILSQSALLQNQSRLLSQNVPSQSQSNLLSQNILPKIQSNIFPQTVSVQNHSLTTENQGGTIPQNSLVQSGMVSERPASTVGNLEPTSYQLMYVGKIKTMEIPALPGQDKAGAKRNPSKNVMQGNSGDVKVTVIDKSVVNELKKIITPLPQSSGDILRNENTSAINSLSSNSLVINSAVQNAADAGVKGISDSGSSVVQQPHQDVSKNKRLYQNDTSPNYAINMELLAKVVEQEIGQFVTSDVPQSSIQKNEEAVNFASVNTEKDKPQNVKRFTGSCHQIYDEVNNSKVQFRKQQVSDTGQESLSSPSVTKEPSKEKDGLCTDDKNFTESQSERASDVNTDIGYKTADLKTADLGDLTGSSVVSNQPDMWTSNVPFIHSEVADMVQSADISMKQRDENMTTVAKTGSDLTDILISPYDFLEERSPCRIEDTNSQSEFGRDNGNPNNFLDMLASGSTENMKQDGDKLNFTAELSGEDICKGNIVNASDNSEEEIMQQDGDGVASMGYFQEENIQQDEKSVEEKEDFACETNDSQRESVEQDRYRMLGTINFVEGIVKKDADSVCEVNNSGKEVTDQDDLVKALDDASDSNVDQSESVLCVTSESGFEKMEQEGDYNVQTSEQNGEMLKQICGEDSVTGEMFTSSSELNENKDSDEILQDNKEITDVNSEQSAENFSTMAEIQDGNHSATSYDDMTSCEQNQNENLVTFPNIKQNKNIPVSGVEDSVASSNADLNELNVRTEDTKRLDSIGTFPEDITTDTMPLQSVSQCECEISVSPVTTDNTGPDIEITTASKYENKEGMLLSEDVSEQMTEVDDLNVENQDSDVSQLQEGGLDRCPTTAMTPSKETPESSQRDVEETTNIGENHRESIKLSETAMVTDLQNSIDSISKETNEIEDSEASEKNRNSGQADSESVDCTVTVDKNNSTSKSDNENKLYNNETHKKSGGFKNLENEETKEEQRKRVLRGSSLLQKSRKPIKVNLEAQKKKADRIIKRLTQSAFTSFVEEDNCDDSKLVPIKPFGKKSRQSKFVFTTSNPPVKLQIPKDTEKEKEIEVVRPSLSPTCSFTSSKSSSDFETESVFDFHSKMDNQEEDSIALSDGSGQNRCLICSKSFRSVLSLKYHIKTACRSTNKQDFKELRDFEYSSHYACMKCGMSSALEFQVQDHVTKCQDDNSTSTGILTCFKCEMCGQIFNSKSVIHKHVSKECPKLKSFKEMKKEQSKELEGRMFNPCEPISTSPHSRSTSPKGTGLIASRDNAKNNFEGIRDSSAGMAASKKVSNDTSSNLSTNSSRPQSAEKHAELKLNHADDKKREKSKSDVGADSLVLDTRLRKRWFLRNQSKITSGGHSSFKTFEFYSKQLSKKLKTKKMESRSHKKKVLNVKEDVRRTELRINKESKRITRNHGNYNFSDDLIDSSNGKNERKSNTTEECMGEDLSLESGKEDTPNTKIKSESISEEVGEQQQSRIVTDDVSLSVGKMYTTYSSDKAKCLEDDETSESNIENANLNSAVYKASSRAGVHVTKNKVTPKKAEMQGNITDRSAGKQTSATDERQDRNKRLHTRNQKTDVSGSDVIQTRSRNSSVGSELSVSEKYSPLRARSESSESNVTERQTRSKGSVINIDQTPTNVKNDKAVKSKWSRVHSGSAERSCKLEDSEIENSKSVKRSRRDKHETCKKMESEESVSIKLDSAERVNSPDSLWDTKHSKDQTQKKKENIGKRVIKQEVESGVVGKRMIKVKKYDQFEVPEFLKTQLKNSNIKRQFKSQRIGGKVLKGKNIGRTGKPCDSSSQSLFNKCSKCGLRFRSKSKLIKHISSIHLSPYKSKYNADTKKCNFVCRYCKMSFRIYVQFLKHVPVHAEKILLDLDREQSFGDLAGVSESKLSRQKQIEKTMTGQDDVKDCVDYVTEIISEDVKVNLDFEKLNDDGQGSQNEDVKRSRESSVCSTDTDGSLRRSKRSRKQMDWKDFDVGRLHRRQSMSPTSEISSIIDGIPKEMNKSVKIHGNSQSNQLKEDQKITLDHQQTTESENTEKESSDEISSPQKSNSSRKLDSDTDSVGNSKYQSLKSKRNKSELCKGDAEVRSLRSGKKARYSPEIKSPVKNSRTENTRASPRNSPKNSSTKSSNSRSNSRHSPENRQTRSAIKIESKNTRCSRKSVESNQNSDHRITRAVSSANNSPKISSANRSMRALRRSLASDQDDRTKKNKGSNSSEKVSSMNIKNSKSENKDNSQTEEEDEQETDSTKVQKKVPVSPTVSSGIGELSTNSRTRLHVSLERLSPEYTNHLTRQSSKRKSEGDLFPNIDKKSKLIASDTDKDTASDEFEVTESDKEISFRKRARSQRKMDDDFVVPETEADSDLDNMDVVDEKGSDYTPEDYDSGSAGSSDMEEDDTDPTQCNDSDIQCQMDDNSKIPNTSVLDFKNTVVDDEEFAYVKAPVGNQSFEEAFKKSIMGSSVNDNKSRSNKLEAEGSKCTKDKPAFLDSFMSYIGGNKGRTGTHTKSSCQKILPSAEKRSKKTNKMVKRISKRRKRKNNVAKDVVQKEKEETSTCGSCENLEKTEDTEQSDTEVKSNDNVISTQNKGGPLSFLDSFLAHCNQKSKPNTSTKFADKVSDKLAEEANLQCDLEQQQQELESQKSIVTALSKSCIVSSESEAVSDHSVPVNLEKNDGQCEKETTTTDVIKSSGDIPQQDSGIDVQTEKLVESVDDTEDLETATSQNGESKSDQEVSEKGEEKIQETVVLPEPKSIANTKSADKLKCTKPSQNRFLENFKTFLSSSKSADETREDAMISKDDKKQVNQSNSSPGETSGKLSGDYDPFSWNENSVAKPSASQITEDDVARDIKKSVEREQRAGSVTSDDSLLTVSSRGTDVSDFSETGLGTKRNRLSAKLSSKSEVRHIYHNGKIWHVGKGAVTSVPVKIESETASSLSVAVPKDSCDSKAEKRSPIVATTLQVIKVDRKLETDVTKNYDKSELNEEINTYTSTTLEDLRKSKNNETSTSKWRIKRQGHGGNSSISSGGKKFSYSFQRNRKN